jgi:O-antigen/teichoic acid export membrane protein
VTVVSPSAAAAVVTPEPIARRYVATLLSQGVQLAASAVIAAVVPRQLGPAQFGSYSYLLTTAGTLRGFTEPSAQQAFFTFSSQDRRSGALTKLFAAWAVAQLALLIAIVLVASVFGVSRWIWPGQHVAQVLLVTVLDWMLFVSLTLRQLSDSKGLTVRSQALIAATSVSTVAGLLVLAWMGRLTFYTFVSVNLVSAVVTAVTVGHLLFIRHHDLCWAGSLRRHARENVRRWWRYAKPLIALEYYTPLAAFAGAYLIQTWYGSTEQGYLGLATRWSSLVLLFTGAALNIVWREVAAAVAKNDRDEASRIYLRFNHVLIFLAATLCVWLSICSRTLVTSVAGEAFRPAVPTMMIMAFYPLAQTCAQLSTAALKAVERTADYRNWSLLISIPDLLLTYFLVAPRDASVPGLGLGAVGIALKMSVYSLLSVQIYEWVVFRFFGLEFGAAMRARVLMLATIVACAAVTVILTSGIERYAAQGPLGAMLISSPVYFLVIGAIATHWPELVGLERRDLDTIRRTFTGVLGRRR